jgi:hypothetical protein
VRDLIGDRSGFRRASTANPDILSQRAPDAQPAQLVGLVVSSLIALFQPAVIELTLVKTAHAARRWTRSLSRTARLGSLEHRRTYGPPPTAPFGPARRA